MAIKRRHHRRDPLISRFEADYAVKLHPDKTVSLTLFHGHDVLSVDHEGRQKDIVKEGFKWLQITGRNSPYHITVLFGEDDAFKEVYFDIIRNTDFSDPENPSFEDLFLDVVYDISGKISILDEEELREAVENGDLDGEEEKEIYQKAEELCLYLKEHGRELVEECILLYQQMKQIIEDER